MRVILIYLKALLTGTAKNDLAEFVYFGVLYKDTINTLVREFGRPQTVVIAYLERLDFPPLKMHKSDRKF